MAQAEAEPASFPRWGPQSIHCGGSHRPAGLDLHHRESLARFPASETHGRGRKCVPRRTTGATPMLETERRAYRIADFATIPAYLVPAARRGVRSATLRSFPARST